MYGLQFYFELGSFFNHDIRVELCRNGWVGGAVEIEKGSITPVVIEYPSDDNFNVFYPIWGSNLTFEFIEQHNCNLESIVTDDERQVRLDYYVDGFLTWTGWVIPDLCSDSANQKNYIISVKATDGLGGLKDVNILTDVSGSVAFDDPNYTSNPNYIYILGTLVPWNWNGQVLANTEKTTYKTLLEIINICLDKTNLDLEFEVTNDLFETTLLTDERVLEKINVDFLRYQDSGTSYTCEQVLFSLLKTLNCVVYQELGKWKIKRVSYLEGRIVVNEHYTKDGVYVKSEQEDLQVPYTEYDSEVNRIWYWSYEGHSRILRNPYRYQNITYEYGSSLNLVPLSTFFFNSFEPIPNSYFLGNVEVSKAEVSLNSLPAIVIKDTQSTNVNNGLLLPIAQVDFIENVYSVSFSAVADNLRVYFEFESDGIEFNGVIIGGGTKFYWNQENNSWDISYTDIDNVIWKGTGNTRQEYNYIFNYYETISDLTEYKFDLPKFPFKGKLKIVLKGGTKTGKYGILEFNVANSFQEIYYQDFKIDGKLVKEVHSFEQTKKVTFSAEDITVYNGDGFKSLSGRSNFTLQDKYTTTKLWKDSSGQEENNIIALSARSIINQYSRRRNIIQGVLFSKRQVRLGTLLNFDSYSKFGNKKLLVVPPLIYHSATDEYEVTLFELSCGRVEGVLSEYYLDSNDYPLYSNVLNYPAFVCEGDEEKIEGSFFEFNAQQIENLWIEVEGEGELDTAEEGRFFEFDTTIIDGIWVEVEGEGVPDEEFSITHLYILEKLFIEQ